MIKRRILIGLIAATVATLTLALADITQIPASSGGAGNPAGNTNGQIQIYSSGVFGFSLATADAAGNVTMKHLLGTGTAPTIASGAGTGSIAGHDIGGRVTLVSAPAPITVVINFGASFATAPACVANDENIAGSATVIQASATTTQLTLKDVGSTGTGNDKLTWTCVAY